MTENTAQKEKATTIKAKVRYWGRNPGLLVMTRGPKVAQNWFVNLGQVQYLTLTLAQQGEGWALGSCDADNKFTARAYFEEKFEAEDALLVIQNALLRGSRGKRRWTKLVKRALSSALMILLIVLLGGILAFAWLWIDAQSSKEAAKQEIAQQIKPQKMENGLPMSADDFLARQ